MALQPPPGAQKVRPGRPYRRRHLRLTWAEEEFTATQGEVPVLTAVLTNTGPEVWNETGQDQLRVVAWLYQGEEELPATHWVAYAPLADPRPALAPGETVQVDAQLLTRDVEALAPGVYEVKAFLAPLNLRSSVGRLRVR